MQAFSSTGNAGQPLVGEIYPSHDDDSENPGIDPVTVLLQPSPSQSQASGSAPHQIHHHHHPGNTSIYRNDADLQHQYDPSTNPYTSLSVMQMPSPPWNIPSQPQVRFPPQFVGYGQRLLANQNQNFNYRPSESPSSIQAPTFSASPLPPLPLSYNSLGLGVSYPSDALSDPFNLDAPVFLDQPDILGDQELRDDIAEVEPTPIVPSHTHIVSVIPRYPLPNLNAFLPQFTEPVLSKDGDVLLPPGCEDECPGPRDPIAATAHPEDDSTFRFYRGPSDRRGRKAKPKAERGIGRAAQPPLNYDLSDNVHERIIKSAKKKVTKHALNLAALTEEGDRVAIADEKLEEAAKHVLGKEKGTEWASHNSGSLYMDLSEPFKDLMQSCRKHACYQVRDGYGLRLPIWTQASESDHQDAVLEDLLDDQIFPPKFLMGRGEDGELHFLEHEVVLNVVLDTVRELKLSLLLDDPGSLACAAAAAVRCVLRKTKGRLLNTDDVEFFGATFKGLYLQLMTYIDVTIKNSPKLLKRWEDYKECIKARLTQK